LAVYYKHHCTKCSKSLNEQKNPFKRVTQQPTKHWRGPKPCQISSKSVKRLQRHSKLTVFQTNLKKQWTIFPEKIFSLTNAKFPDISGLFRFPDKSPYSIFNIWHVKSVSFLIITITIIIINGHPVLTLSCK